MSVATVQRIHLSQTSQSLIDSRLDTIERMLLGRVPRAERMAIIGEVESQIHEVLGERDADDLSREDVLAVLARLDPPEAYLQEDGPAADSPPMARGPIRPVVRSVQQGNHRVARVSGILGLSALAFLMLLPVCYVFAVTGQSVFPVFLGFAVSLIMLVCGVLGIALGFYARTAGAWALVGLVTSILAILLSLCTFTLFVLLG